MFFAEQLAIFLVIQIANSSVRTTEATKEESVLEGIKVRTKTGE